MNMDLSESFPDWYLEEQALSTAKVFFLRDENVRVNDISETDAEADLLVHLRDSTVDPVPVQVIGVRRLPNTIKGGASGLLSPAIIQAVYSTPIPFLMFVYSAEDEETYLGFILSHRIPLHITSSQKASASEAISAFDLGRELNERSSTAISPSSESLDDDSTSARVLDLLKRLM